MASVTEGDTRIHRTGFHVRSAWPGFGVPVLIGSHKLTLRFLGEWSRPPVDVAMAMLGRGAHRVVHLLDVLNGSATEPADVVRAGDDLLPRLAHEDLMRSALRASCGLTDHLSLREKIRFII